MTEQRVTPGAYTSPIYKVRGQRSRWRYPNENLSPEYCEILRDVNITERGVASVRYGYGKYHPDQLAGAEVPTGLYEATFSSGTTRRLVVTPTKIYSDDGTTRTDITGTALNGTADSRAHFEFLKDQVIISNGVDTPRVWAGTLAVTTTAMSGVPFTAITDMMVHQNLLVAVGPTESAALKPTRVRWCDINRQTFEVDITNWPTANRYEIYDGGPAIVGAVDCWGKAMVFKKDGLYPGGIVYDVLGHYSWQLDQPRRGFTPVSSHAIVSRPEFLLCAAEEGLVVFNEGMEMEVVNNDDYTEWKGLNRTRLQYAQAYVREGEHQVRILCSSSSNTAGHDYMLVWDWDDGNLWIDRPNDVLSYGHSITVSGVEQDWLGGYGGYLYTGNRSTYKDDDGVGIRWQVRMHQNDLGLPGRRKHVLNVRTFYRYVSGTQGATLRLRLDGGRQSSVTDQLTFGTPYKWNTGIQWNSGKLWSGYSLRSTDTWVNRMCETLAPEWTGNLPASIEGYQVEFVLLEE